MDTNWYVVKVMPGKERSLTEQFNKEIGLGKIKNILRFICPTEKELVTVKNKKVTREKVLYGVLSPIIPIIFGIVEITFKSSSPNFVLVSK